MMVALCLMSILFQNNKFGSIKYYSYLCPITNQKINFMLNIFKKKQVLPKPKQVIKIQSTVIPSEKVSFNQWARYIYSQSQQLSR